MCPTEAHIHEPKRYSWATILARTPYLVPAILSAIACSQIACTQLSTLTRWKGGGFGMFAERDSSDSRRIIVQVTDPSGDIHRVRVPLGRFDQPRTLTVPFWAETRSFPTSRNLLLLARTVAAAELLPARTTSTLSHRLARSTYAHLLRPLVAGESVLDLVSPRRSALSLRPSSVEVRVVTFRFDTVRMAVTLQPVGDPVWLSTQDLSR